MTSTSEVEGQGAYVSKIGKKHPNGSHFRNSKTTKCIVDISDINAIGSQDLGLYKCWRSWKKVPARIENILI